MKIQKCFYIVLVLFIVTCGLLWYSYKQYQESSRLVDEIEYYDSLNTYNKVYYSKTFSSLRKENKHLYDSLKQYKDKIDYIVQFYHEKEYNTGNSTVKPNIKDSTVYDTIPMVIPSVARTYEYVSEPNDTFQYKLNVNSFTEPKWYSIQAKVKNKFTIVNKEDGDANHITIKPDNGGTVVANTFDGNATTATTATKATQDSDGNAINSTYLKLSGGTVTGTLTLIMYAAFNFLSNLLKEEIGLEISVKLLLIFGVVEFVLGLAFVITRSVSPFNCGLLISSFLAVHGINAT